MYRLVILSEASDKVNYVMSPLVVKSEMSRRLNLLISACITAVISLLFGFFVLNHGKFELNEEYKLVPDGYILPKGCDIKIDVQTGDTWARIPSNSHLSSDSVILSNEENIKEASPFPEYQNVTKSRILSRVSSNQIEMIDSSLNSLNLESSWEFLEEESSAMEIGLAILESKNFIQLRTLLASESPERALKLLSNCLQNNSLAIEKFLELKVHLNEIEIILGRNEISKVCLKNVLRIIESIKTLDVEFIKSNSENIARHFNNEYEDRVRELLY